MAEWYYRKNGISVGPFNEENLHLLIRQGRVTGQTILRMGSSLIWKSASDFPELASCFTPPELESNAVTAEILSVDDTDFRFSCPVCHQNYTGMISVYKGKKIVCRQCSAEIQIPQEIAPPESVPEILPDEIPEGEISCPHCWKTFPRQYIMYISAHPSLIGDPVCGEHEQKRFFPVVFNTIGQPLDSEGMVCIDMACPHCHLRLPASIIDLNSLYFSIVGAPASGKSYFLTAFTHVLRQVLPESFGCSFLDVDPQMNSVLNSYEKMLFMSVNRNNFVALPKTQQIGEGFSNQIFMSGLAVDLPKPFIFEMKSLFSRDKEKHLNVIFYDNAGEHFQPGSDVVMNPATQHLSHSNGIIFIFDPSADASMRRECDQNDPQIAESHKITDQNVLLCEMISRLRRHANLRTDERYPVPCVICVAKHDVWSSLLDRDLRKLNPVRTDASLPEAVLDTNLILDVSFSVRELLLKTNPAIVNTAESFFEDVIYIPTSNFGTLATKNANGAIGIIPENINPLWTEIPFLYLLSKMNLIQKAKPDIHPHTLPMPGCKLMDDILIFEHPETRHRIHLPRTYCGACLTIAGKRYRLPENDQEKFVKRKTGKDSFWN